MGEILSHAEIEAILNPSGTYRPVPSPDKPADATVTSWERHDFRRAEPLRGAALKVLHAILSSFGEQSKARFQTLLQTRVEIAPVGSCHTTSAEFLATLPPDCTICDLAVSNSEPECLLVWDNPLLSALFSKMLGGGQDEDQRKSVRQRLTNIERRLLSKLNDVLLVELAEFLKKKLVVAHVHEGTASATQSPLIAASIWLTFEINSGGTRGVIHLGLSRTLFGNAKDCGLLQESSAMVSSLPAGIQKITVEVSASLARLRMRTSDVASLQVGDILMTDLQQTEPVLLRLGDRTLCPAAIGTHSGRKALRLVQSPQHGQPR